MMRRDEAETYLRDASAARFPLVAEFLLDGERVLDDGPVSWLDIEQSHGVDAASGFLFATNARLIFVGDTGIAHAWALGSITSVRTRWFPDRHSRRIELHHEDDGVRSFIGSKLFAAAVENVVVQLGPRYRTRDSAHRFDTK